MLLTQCDGTGKWAPNGNLKHNLATAALKIYDDCGEWRGQVLPLLPMSPPRRPRLKPPHPLPPTRER